MKRVLLLLTMILSCITLTAQTLSKNDPLKFDADYYLMEKDFTKALNTYKNILRSEPENADIKYKMGICFLNSENEKEQAIPYLEEASEKVSEKYNSNSFDESNAPIDALFLLGSAYRVNNQIDKAIESYKKYRSYLDSKDEYNINVVEQYINSCELAASMQQNPVPVSLNNLGTPVNNASPNYNAVLSGDGKTMFFTSPAKQGYDIFLTTLDDTTWSIPKNITTILGTGKYMKTSDLSYDGSMLLLTLDDPMNADIYISRFNKGKWSKVEPLGKEINSKFNETHGSLSNDGRILYFTSDRKGGEGDLDIYKAEPDEKGFWGKPVNLGPIINTPFNEETPFISEIGDKLYFSSEGHNGIGGYDIYYFDFSSPAKGVVNLGYPLNSTDNDLFFVPTGDGHSGYYSLKGEDTQGGRDIYQIFIPEPAIPESEMIASADSNAEELKAETTQAMAEDTSIVLTVQMPTVAATDSAAPGISDQSLTMSGAETLLQESDSADQNTEPQNIEQIPGETVQSIVESVTMTEETISEPAIEAVTETIAESIPEETVREEAADAVVSTESSYRVQILALLKPVDLTRFNSLPGVAVARNGDRWFRYTLGNTTDRAEAERLLADLKSKGYRDAFIRPHPVYPQYTIQVMAVPGPVVNLERFSNLPAISVTKGQDSFCRYTTGEFPTREDALNNLGKIKELGYTTAFVTRMK